MGVLVSFSAILRAAALAEIIIADSLGVVHILHVVHRVQVIPDSILLILMDFSIDHIIVLRLLGQSKLIDDALSKHLKV